MPLDLTVRSSLRTYTPASNMLLYVPPTIDQTASFVTSSGHIIVKMMESRAPPEPPEAMTCSIPSFFSIRPSVSALICDSDTP